MKIKLFFVSIIIWLSSLSLFGQSFTEIRYNYNCPDIPDRSFTRLNGIYNGALCEYVDEGILLALYLYENGKIVFVLFFSEAGQLDAELKDFQKNSLQKFENLGLYHPDDPDNFPFKQQCYGVEFYDSGNIKKEGMVLLNEDPLVEYYFYEDYPEQKDFGKSISYKNVTEKSTIYETRLNGKINGTQIFYLRATGLVEKINYYKLGDLKAQFLFNADGSIKSIVYEIEPDDTSSDYKYRGKYLEYAPDGTKIRSTELSFNDLPQ